MKYQDNPILTECIGSIEDLFYRFRSLIQFTGEKCPQSSHEQKSNWLGSSMSFVNNLFKGTSKCYKHIHSYMKNWLIHQINDDVFNCMTYNLKPKMLYEKYIYRTALSKLQVRDCNNLLLKCN